MQMEQTLVIVKPDGLQRRLIGQIIGRFERKGLKIVALKLARISEKLAREHYAVHQGKEFYEPLIRYMTAGPVVLMVLEGIAAIDIVRSLAGPTFGADAPAGTIRGDLAASKRYNLVHGSDSLQSAVKEIALFFKADELLDYEMSDIRWVYDMTSAEPI